MSLPSDEWRRTWVTPPVTQRNIEHPSYPKPKTGPPTLPLKNTIRCDIVTELVNNERKSMNEMKLITTVMTSGVASTRVCILPNIIFYSHIHVIYVDHELLLKLLVI